VIIIIQSFIFDDFIWSFSRLNSFYQCKYQFKQQYIDCLQGESNFFAEYGSFIHNILEKFFKGELAIYELSTFYKEGYQNAIQHSAPPNKFVDLNQSYYKAGLKYFNEIEDYDEYNIIDVEKKVDFKIDNIKMVGYIDLLAKDKDNRLHIIDHKSSNIKSLKSQKAKDYWKQMSLYSIPIKEEFGEYPCQLHINAFRKQQWYTTDFNIEEVSNVKKWATNTVDLVRKEDEWNPTIDEFFCSYLCNFRNKCKYRWGN